MRIWNLLFSYAAHILVDGEIEIEFQNEGVISNQYHYMYTRMNNLFCHKP